MSFGTKLTIWIVGGFVAFFILLAITPFTMVSAGEKGVVLKWGQVVRTLDPGIHWRTPIAEDVVKVDIRTQVEEVEAQAASKDLQDVTTKVALNFNVDPDTVTRLVQEIGIDEYKRVIIDPAIQEAVKGATAKHTAEELITKREVVKEELSERLRARLAETGVLILTQISITDFTFSSSFNSAIEAKVTAEQEALTAKNKLEQVKFEAEQKIATAHADAENIRLQSQAANNDKFIELKRLEVQAEFAKRWNGVLPVNLYGSAPIPFLDLGR